MRYFLLITTFISILSSASAEEDNLHQFKTAVGLCREDTKGFENTAFIAAKAALKHYQNLDNICLFLKGEICRCDITCDYLDEMSKYADEVIEKSNFPLHIAIAWYRKSCISYVKNDDENALSYCKICMKALEQLPYKKDDSPGVSERELYEIYCYVRLRSIYENNKNQEELEKVNKYLNSITAETKPKKDPNLSPLTPSAS